MLVIRGLIFGDAYIRGVAYIRDFTVLQFKKQGANKC